MILPLSCAATFSASDSRLLRNIAVVRSSTFVSVPFPVATLSSTFKIRLVVEESVVCGADLVYVSPPVSSWPYFTLESVPKAFSGSMANVDVKQEGGFKIAQGVCP